MARTSREQAASGPLAITGVLITRADRTLVSRQVEAEVRTYFGDMVYDRAVPSSVKFREAYAHGVPLIHYDRFSPGARAYRELAIYDRNLMQDFLLMNDTEGVKRVLLDNTANYVKSR